MTVHVPKLYRMANNLDIHGLRAAYGAGLQPDVVYWVDAIRSARTAMMGGYYAVEVRTTYKHFGGISPNLLVATNVPMDFLTVVDDRPAALAV